MKRIIPLLALMGSVSFASANFFTSESPAELLRQQDLSLYADSELAGLDGAQPFGLTGNYRAYAFGLVGACSLLAIVISRRGAAGQPV